MNKFILCTCILFNIAFPGFSQINYINYSVQTLVIDSNKLTIIQEAGFPYGYHTTCPYIDTFEIDRNNDIINVQVFYDLHGVWSQVGCVSFDTLYIENIPPNSYSLIFHTNIIAPDTGTLKDVEVDTNYFSIVGIKEQQIREQLKIYPNPSKDFLNIEGLKGLDLIEVKIFDLQGKVVQLKVSKSVQQNQLEIDISYLPAANYLLMIKTTEGKTHQKFVKLK